MQKSCRECGIVKPLDEYYKRPSGRDGYYNICKECSKSHTKDWKKNLSDEQKDRYRRSEQAALYGLTLEQFQEMSSAQNDRCYICRGTSQDGRGKDRFLSVDHNRSCCAGNRSCGKCVRRLLCTKCNSALGMVSDSIETLRRMIDYIKEHN